MRKGFLRKLTEDFSLNILASVLSTGVMQLIVYPSLAKRLTPSDYGVMLTAMGYVSVITLAFGNNLCNARLIQENKYVEKKCIGDFQLLKIVMIIFSIISVFIACLTLNLRFSIVVGVIIATILTVIKSYYLVAYRIKIDYCKNLIANLFIGVGYIIGAIILIRIVEWPWIFSLGCITGIVYIYFSSDIIKEPYKKTPLFWDSFKMVMVLAVGGLIGNATTYLDRFLIYPILGGESVSVYATAAFFSKSINLLLAPITSVLLSYLTAKKLVLNQKKYLQLNLLMGIGGVLFWIISISVGSLITGVLYPTLIESAKEYIPYVSFGIIFSVVGSFSNIVVLAYSHIKWQTILPLIKFVVYVLLGYIMTVRYQLMGLCISIIIINVGMFIITFSIGLISVRRRSKT